MSGEAAERLERILRQTHASLVVTSTWRKYYSPDILTRFLRRAGAPSAIVTSCTPVLDAPSGTHISGVRHEEIEVWMWIHGRPSSFAILEDAEPMGDLEPYVVRTEENDFLREKHVEPTIALLTNPLMIKA